MDFAFGLVLAALICTLYHFLEIAFIDNHWQLNQAYNLTALAKAGWWVLKSVLFEEFVFRGALLYILIRLVGGKWACLISAAAFGVYHWFSYELWGTPFQMIIIFVMTGILGWVLAYAFTQLKSMYLPIAVHFGWNLLHIVIFSSGPLGPQLLVKANAHYLEGALSLLVFLFQVFALPLATLFYVRYRQKETASA
ncbi:CPBP family intramembrane glutamic endopeptidase [Arachidicoccus rhizosphaerae]|nr:CPBP family intramembrane glutamic endopeptidase [Arachidicoccus rhizosphaerae]